MHRHERHADRTSIAFVVLAFLVSASLLVSCTDKEESDVKLQGLNEGNADTSANPRVLGPLKIGMTKTSVDSLGFSTTSATLKDKFGGSYIQDAITLKDGVVLKVVYSDRGVVWEISTASPSFRTPEGARVGDSLKRLRQIYPNGKLEKGVEEEGSYLVFNSGVRFFEFDDSKLTFECLKENRGCPKDFENWLSKGIYVR